MDCFDLLLACLDDLEKPACVVSILILSLYSYFLESCHMTHYSCKQRQIYSIIRAYIKIQLCYYQIMEQQSPSIVCSQLFYFWIICIVSIQLFTLNLLWLHGSSVIKLCRERLDLVRCPIPVANASGSTSSRFPTSTTSCISTFPKSCGLLHQKRTAFQKFILSASAFFWQCYPLPVLHRCNIFSLSTLLALKSVPAQRLKTGPTSLFH